MVLAADDLLTPAHIAKLRSVAAAEISPDGKRVAYALRTPRIPFAGDDGPPWVELHIVDREGDSRPMVTGEVDVSAVRWTPNGRSISYIAKRGKDKTRAIYSIPIDGGESTRIVSHATDIKEYSWSPDGKELAFLATEVEAENVQKQKDNGFNQEIFEEDRRRVRVWIASVGDTEAKPRLLDSPGSASMLTWSADGAKVAVALAPTPLVDDDLMRRKVHLLDTKTGAVVARWDNPGKLGQIRWSPTGEHLAVISAEDVHDPSAGRLMVAAASGGPLVDVLTGYLGEVRAIEWQDPHTVMFIGDEGVWSTFGEVRHDGTERKTHVPVGKAVLSAFSLSRDGQTACMLRDTPAHPTEVYYMAHGDSGPRRLTDSNPWLKDIRFAEQEPIEYRARDGLALDGILIRPLDHKESEKYPLIVAVHGGPEAHDRNGWLTGPGAPGQVAAARGFAVFYPNYRGSTGRGVEFSKLGQGDFGGKEFDDVVDAVDHLIALGLADRARVGVTGGSYGGFATAWCATHYSARFAAAVMNVGVSNHISMAGTTDIPEEMYLVHARQRLWDDWQVFLERSPIFHVHESRTPLLIMHGKDDPRVPYSQSVELFRHLKTLGQAPVRLVLYPGEGHGNRKAAARLDYHLRMLQWFEHYLKGPGGDPPPYDLEYPFTPPPNVDQPAKPSMAND